MSDSDFEKHMEYEKARDRCYVPDHLRESEEQVDAEEDAAAEESLKVDHSLDLPPPAIMEMKGNDTLVICAWCSTKEAADAWGKARGYTLSHSICPVCKPVHFPELAASEKAFEECLAAAKQATAYAAGVALDLRHRRAELLGVSLEELARRDAQTKFISHHNSIDLRPHE